MRQRHRPCLHHLHPHERSELEGAAGTGGQARGDLFHEAVSKRPERVAAGQSRTISHWYLHKSANARLRSISPSPPDARRRRGPGRGGAFCWDSPLSSSHSSLAGREERPLRAMWEPCRGCGGALPRILPARMAHGFVEPGSTLGPLRCLWRVPTVCLRCISHEGRPSWEIHRSPTP